MNSKIFDIAILGAGFAGAATAYHLSREKSLRILLLEQEKCHGVHASGRNAGLLRQAVLDPETARLIQETRAALLRPPEDWSEKKLFNETGSFLLGERKKIISLRRVLETFSSPAQIYSPQTFPPGTPPLLQKFLKHARYDALLFSSGDGVVDIDALLKNFLTAAQARDVEMRFNQQVDQLSRNEDHWRVGCGGEKFYSRVLVNAAGAWASELGQWAGSSAPAMTPHRRHLFVSEPLAWSKPDWPFVWDIRNEFYFRPESGGILLTPGDEEPHPARAPDVDPQSRLWLAKKLKAHFPDLAAVEILQGWACLRTRSPEGRIKIGWDSQQRGLFWVAALGGHGMSASFGIGRLAARQIIDSWGINLDVSNRA